ncbi:protein STPG4 [Chionomys nivalis]|uniref:protein STPG4 n=1 Tax=Chionomys nivalis TaxID=269649 RepID=UPI002594E7F9|nr:protein STPG4 [Chionomys nivalis]
MDEPATAAINPSGVPREDLGRGEPLLAASKQIRKSSSLAREGWWRVTLTNTPIPGTYHIKTFIEESLLNPVKATYNFKNEGRKRIPLVQRNDPVPTDLPQYKPPDFLELLKKQMASYSFKDQPRPNPTTLVDKDESLQLCPGQYELLPAPVPKSSSRSFVFRSAVQRFPPNYFTPHEGPGPGEYNLKAPPAGSVTSCFRSKVPRFLPVGSKTPGPGAYTASRQFPKQSPTIAKMGREHSLFFNNTIGF